MSKFDGQRIKIRRESLKMTQEALAEKVGTSQKNISDYERGSKNNVSADMLTRLSQSLHVPVGYFFEDVEDTELDGLESFVLEEFRALPSDAKEFALKFLRDLHQFTSHQSK